MVLRFVRALGLLDLLDDARRLDDLREFQQQEGRQLAVDTNGREHPHVGAASHAFLPIVKIVPSTQAD